MRASPALVASETPAGPPHAGVEGAVRTLVELIEATRAGAAVESSGGTHRSEEVLLDAEVEGCRYLLVRMPTVERNRIQLSPREHEIVRMVAKGHPNKVIADVLNISAWTVCTHLRRIFAKLGVGSRAAMVAQMLEMEMHVAEHRGPASVK